MTRCFIAVNLPKEIKEKIGRIASELDIDGVKVVEATNLHITLKFLGEIDNEAIGQIENILEKIKLEKFKISIEGIGVFPNEKYVKVVWIGCVSKELEKLAETIDTGLKGKLRIESESFESFDRRALSVKYWKDIKSFQSFVGHLTIARIKKKVDLSRFLNENRNVRIGEVTVNSFELMESRLGPGGPEYLMVKQFLSS
ncbi:MAG: RNA 2',3'-cyclic phosphodiesterase [Candidatus Micrarchaeota archaeon]